MDPAQSVSGASADTQIPHTTVPDETMTPAHVNSSMGINEMIEEEAEMPMPDTQPITITIVYDNNAYDERLKSSWGFSALIEYRESELLFDTGGDGPTLLENMRILGIDPNGIESVVLSHAHGDHTGGLNALIEAGARPTVYLLPSFPVSFKSQVERVTPVIEVSPGQTIAEGISTTGEMGRNIPEQALVIKTEGGLVVITGCAHPGIVEMVEQARAMFDEPVRLAMGGFHLRSKSKAEMDAILKDFRRLEVEQVAPCHCSGEKAIAMFAAEYGDDFILAGVGRIIKVNLRTGE